MKTEILKLDIPQTAMLWRCINSAQMLHLISTYDQNFKRRARAAFRRNLENPGDCATDLPMLAALAVAEAQVGRSAGWIPEVQRIAYLIVSKPGF
jgi:hypothetical protein